MSTLTRTLHEARAEFKTRLDEGTTCPCCERYAKRYRRKFNSSMAASFVVLVQLSQRALVSAALSYNRYGTAPSPSVLNAAWVHADEVGQALKKAGSKASYPQGELGKLVHWGLVEAQIKGMDYAESRGRASGYWRPTSAGIEFANRTSSVQRVAVIWDNTLEGFEGEEVRIDDVMGDHFSYAGLMAGAGG